jgi:hypothetical protein
LLKFVADLAYLNGSAREIAIAYAEGQISLVTFGLNMNFLFQLVEKMVSGCLHLEEEMMGRMPASSYTNCPSAGLAGIIHRLFLIHEKAHAEASDLTAPRLLGILHDAADELCMPATSKYLDRWIFSSQRNANASRRFLPFGEPITITTGDLPLLPKESDDKQHLKYLYVRPEISRSQTYCW